MIHGLRPIRAGLALAAVAASLLLAGCNADTIATVPSRALAVAIAAEFAAQGEFVLPATTPLYNLASSAIDQFVHEDLEAAEDIEAEMRAARLSTFDRIAASDVAQPTAESARAPHAAARSQNHSPSGRKDAATPRGSGRQRSQPARSHCTDSASSDFFARRRPGTEEATAEEDDEDEDDGGGEGPAPAAVGRAPGAGCGAASPSSRRRFWRDDILI